MPTYTFKCFEENGGCNHHFEITCSMDEIVNLKPKCPNCNKKKSVFRNYDDVYIFDGSPKTLGALAERNGSRMSADEIHEIKTKNRIQKPKFSGSMPQGGSLLPVDSKGRKIMPKGKVGKSRQQGDRGRPKNG